MTDTTARRAGLRKILIARQRELQSDVHNRIRDGLRDRPNEVGDEVELSDGHIQGDIDFALLQMRGEMLARIEQALVRLDAGEYGSCAECNGRISERRLRALPFAVRCQSCEERREQEHGRARQLAQRRAHVGLFPDAVGP